MKVAIEAFLGGAFVGFVSGAVFIIIALRSGEFSPFR